MRIVMVSGHACIRVHKMAIPLIEKGHPRRVRPEHGGVGRGRRGARLHRGNALMGNLDFEIIGRALPYLAGGLQYTVQLTLVAAAGGVVFGTLLALARLSSLKPLALAAAGYVNLMRATPLLLVIFWFYFLVPVLLQMMTGADAPPRIGAERSAYFTFITPRMIKWWPGNEQM